METDDLTGLLNRKRFEECFSVEIQQARREQHPLSCLLMDLDWFKHINDRWGHGVGDQALQQVAHTMTRVTFGAGYVCRFGGDEFCLLLPEVGEVEASIIGEQMLREIESIRLDVDEKYTVGNWGESFSRKREPFNEREEVLREYIQRLAPTVMCELRELHEHAAANGDCVVAETVNTVTRIQEQVGDLLAFCQVDHRFEPERVSATGGYLSKVPCACTPTCREGCSKALRFQ